MLDKRYAGKKKQLRSIGFELKFYIAKNYVKKTLEVILKIRAGCTSVNM